MMAAHAAWLLQPHLKKGSRITGADLLGERDKATPAPLPGIFESKEDLVAALKAQRAQREKERGEG